MRDWLKNNKEMFKSWKFKAIVGAILVVLIVGLTIGVEFYGYLAAVLVFGLFYAFAKQAEAEKILSPNEKNTMEQDLKELEEEADLIKTHIKDNKEDLEAKFLLRSIEKEIEVIRAILEGEQEMK